MGRRLHRSLSQYLWETHRLTDLPMGQADQIRKLAMNVQDKKIKTKLNIHTPLLKVSDWDRVWAKVNES